MVSLYSGTPRSGKSLHAASTIYWHLKRGLPVIANFRIRCDLVNKKHPDDVPFFYVENDDLTPEWLSEFKDVYFFSIGKPVKEQQILLVIDECQLIFNAREWQKTGRSQWLSFFTQHGKLGYDIILIAQFDRMIDRQIRSLIEYEFIHRKLINFGIKGLFLLLLMGGRQFVCVKVWYPLNEQIGSEFFRLRKKYYQLYDTFDTFGNDLGGIAPAAQVAPGLRAPAQSAAADANIEQKHSVALIKKPGCDKLNPPELAV